MIWNMKRATAAHPRGLLVSLLTVLSCTCLLSSSSARPAGSAVGGQLPFTPDLSYPVSLPRPNVNASHKSKYTLLPKLREQATIQDSWRDERFKNVPQLMRKYGVDVWIMSMLEYSEDTVFFSMKDAVEFSARRRTLYLFYSENTSLNTTSGPIVANPSLWLDNTPQLWLELSRVLAALNPKTIALNISPTEKFADGLHAGEYEQLSKHLGPEWMSRVVRRPMLAIEYVSTRVGGNDGSQLMIWRRMQDLIWTMISEAFSSQVIVPGVTTTQDVVWWFRDKMEELHVTTWFHPSVSRFNQTSETHPGQPFPSPSPDSDVIREGDMLHTDVGIFAMGLATDTQHLAYVLRQNETEVPLSLREGLKKSNHMQDLLLDQMIPDGRSGDDILKRTRKDMELVGIEGLVYSHPIGDWGHSAGTLIGMTNLQTGVPVTGTFPLLEDSWYSIELSASHYVPEWNRTQNFFQEEDVFWNSATKRFEWAHRGGRQEEFWLIKPSTHKQSR